MKKLRLSSVFNVVFIQICSNVMDNEARPTLYKNYEMSVINVEVKKKIPYGKITKK